MGTLIQSLDILAALTGVTQAQADQLASITTGALERACRRPLTLARFLEEGSPGTRRILRLKGRPVVSLDQVATDLVTAIEIQYVGSPRPWRASALVPIPGVIGNLYPSSLVLSTALGGITSPEVLEFASDPTVQDLAATVNASASWSAVVGPGMGSCPSTELRPGGGDAIARPAAFLAFSRSLGPQDYQLEGTTGRITFPQIRPAPSADPTRSVGCVGLASLVRVSYSAGYNGDPSAGPVTVPEDLAEAAILTARAILDARNVSGVVRNLSLGNSSVTAGDVGAIPDRARELLSGYVDRRF